MTINISEQTGGMTAQPVSFDGCVGIFHPAHSDLTKDVAVLFVSPWGMEELCSRKFQRVIAERLSAVGIASLRFDYQGSGDALDPEDVGKDADWSANARSALDYLLGLSGVSRIVVVAQGLGCLITIQALAGEASLSGMALLAPVVSGRAYLRELAMWSSMIDDGLGLRPEQRLAGSGAIAGMQMPLSVAEKIKKANISNPVAAPAGRVLVLSRPGRAAEADFARHLQSLGGDMEEAEFTGYDDLVSSPTLSRIPESIVSRLVEWVLFQARANKATEPVDARIVNAPQSGRGFVEQPVQFGDNGRLFGVLCEPADRKASSSVLFMGAAYDRHAGWGRLSVKMARELARSGVASLRFDAANIADSPPVHGAPEQVLYDVAQNDDVVAALDFLSSRITGPIVAAGRCSGAYLAFNGALVDNRIRSVVAVNPVVFHWLKGRSVDEALHKRPRSFGEYRQRFLQGATFKRLFSGDVDVVSAVLNILKATAKKVATKTARLFRKNSDEGRVVYAAFETLRANGTVVSLLYSDNDDGLEHFRYYFDSDGRGLSAYANASMTIISDADHNLSTPEARAVYLQTVKRLALDLALEGKATA